MAQLLGLVIYNGMGNNGKQFGPVGEGGGQPPCSWIREGGPTSFPVLWQTGQTGFGRTRRCAGVTGRAAARIEALAVEAQRGARRHLDAARRAGRDGD